MEKKREIHPLDHPKDLADKLIDWFLKEGRSLPWRETSNPYHILVSEVMLQQTQVKTVIPYYLRFIQQLPDFEALKEASEDTLHTLWEGLGYYSRVKRLQQFAYAVINEHEGKIPTDKSVLLKLPGIGPYTAGALLSFCFHQVEPAMDGNVKRVMSRLICEEEDVTKAHVSARLEEALRHLLPDTIYPFNQGMIELGALYCTPLKPQCEQCPLHEYCLAAQRGIAERLPFKPTRVKQKTIHVPILILEEEGEILFVKRETVGLLSSLWGLPMDQRDYDVTDGFEEKMIQGLKEVLIEAFNLPSEILRTMDVEYVGHCKHVFSSIIWDQFVFYSEVKGIKRRIETVEEPQTRWSESSKISIPTAFKRALRCWNEK